MQNRFTTQQPVLDEKGHPNAGYSTKSILKFDRAAIKAPSYRIKEWDFYQVSDDRMCLQFTYGHASYVGQVNLMLFDFVKGEKLLDCGTLIPFPFNGFHMPEDAEKDGVLEYDKHGLFLRYETRGEKRFLSFSYRKGEQLTKAEIMLARKHPESLVINLPFEEGPKMFYYNQKINCMTAEGYVSQDDKQYTFREENAFGILDWGRGVWPFHNEWYWSNGTGYLDGEMFAFNLGCGFGNTDQATENILFYKGQTHKLGKVKFTANLSNYMEPWVIEDEEGRLKLTLTPTYDRTTRAKVLWIDNCTHQMFGRFEGYAILDDGSRLEVHDVISFAEHAVNNW